MKFSQKKNRMYSGNTLMSKLLTLVRKMFEVGTSVAHYKNMSLARTAMIRAFSK